MTVSDLQREPKRVVDSQGTWLEDDEGMFYGLQTEDGAWYEFGRGALVAPCLSRTFGRSLAEKAFVGRGMVVYFRRAKEGE